MSRFNKEKLLDYDYWLKSLYISCLYQPINIQQTSSSSLMIKEKTWFTNFKFKLASRISFNACDSIEASTLTDDYILL